MSHSSLVGASADLADQTSTSTPDAGPRTWAWVGVLASAASIAGIQLSMSLTPVHDQATPATAASVTEHLSGRIPQLIAFHVVTVVAALLLLVVAAGLKRRLDAQAPAGSLLPAVAANGLVLVSGVLILGTGLNTEFAFGLSQPELLVATDVSFYSHWIATIAWLWVTAGVSAVAVGLAAVRGAAPRWLGWVSLVLGGLTTLVGVSPLQYLAGFVGPVWLLVAALAFALGDRARR